MTSPPETPATGPTATNDRLASLASRLAHAIEHELPPGELAQLRRADPAEPGGPAFWKLAVQYLEPAGELAHAGDRCDEDERQWAALLAGMAWTKGLHRHGRPAGAALAAAGYSELRFVKLLRARDGALLAAIRQVAQFLASKGEPVDWLQLIRLVRRQDGEIAERHRRALAHDYYRTASAPQD